MEKVNLNLFKVFDTLSEKNLQINPFYIKITGSITGGYFLTQLIYLFRNAFDYNEFFKPDDYFYEKLLLTEWELRSQKKKLVELGLINIRYGKGFVTYYSVNIKKIIDLLINQENSSAEDSSGQRRGFLVASAEDSSSPYITPNTTTKNYKPPKPPKGGTDSSVIENVFERFWEMYPNKKGKEKARQSFIKLTKSKSVEEVEELIKQMTEGLISHLVESKHHEDIHKLHPDWKVFYPAWPHGSTWINQKRWLDEYETNGDKIYEGLQRANDKCSGKSIQKLFK